MKYSILYPVLPSSLSFLQQTLPLLLENNRQDFEVIVSINGSMDSNFKLPVFDERVTFTSPNRLLSMNQHYEFIINLSKGTWVQLLGADDFVTPEYFLRLDKLVDRHPTVEIYNWSRSYYYWNSPETISPTQLDFRVSGSKKHFYALRYVFTLFGCLSIFELPQLYTCSLIKKSFISKVASRSQGCFYHSIIPDVYSSIALQENNPRVKSVAIPLTWVGTSSSSYGSKGRIYSDLSKGSLCARHEHNDLDKKISRESHSQSFESILLLECLFRYTEMSGKNARVWKTLLYANYLSDLVFRKEFGSNKEQLSLFYNTDRLCFLYGLLITPIATLFRYLSHLLGKVSYYYQIKSKKRIFLKSNNDITPSVANSIFASKCLGNRTEGI